MIFVYSAWERFCAALKEKGIFSLPAREVSGNSDTFLVLKHDIENTPAKAYKLAEIESKYGHRCSYYAQAYLLEDPKNVEILRKIQALGHEVSYHYDVMDSNHGDLDGAIREFEAHRARFEELGFPLVTVCQHGNPIVERVGYTSNRDFFRSWRVRELYPSMADIMVNYKEQYCVEYTYFSDAGRQFKMIFDPLNNDVVSSDEKNVPYEDLRALLAALPKHAIISTHPHRWTGSAVVYLVKEKIFMMIKAVAKLAARVPFLKKIMSRYYYLAKKL